MKSVAFKNDTCKFPLIFKINFLFLQIYTVGGMIVNNDKFMTYESAIFDVVYHLLCD